MLLLGLFLGFLGMEILGKSLAHDDGKHQGGISIDLDGLGGDLDLPPGDGLVRASASITAIKLLGGVDVNGEVRPIPLSARPKVPAK